ncbi:MAG: sulfatase, partial [Halobacteriales archaeon]
GETENLVGTGASQCEEIESVLSQFEDRAGGEWKTVDDAEVLGDMSEDAKDRLEDLGYID